MSRRFSVDAVFRAVDRVSRPVGRMQTRVRRVTRAMGRGFERLNRQVKRLTSGIKKVGAAAALGLGVAGAAFADVIGTGADFEKTIVSAAVKFPGEIRKGSEAFKELEDAARKTGATTEFSASEAAKALNFLAMAGFDSKASIAALPGVVDLATAAEIDLAQATDVASDSLGAFGLMTKDAEQLGKNLARVNDVIAKTTTTANTNVEAMFETIKDGAANATAAGASIETFAALTGVLANSGVKASRAGTTLKNIFVTLAAPTPGAEKLLRRLKVRTKDAQGNVRDVIDVFQDLNKALEGKGSGDRLAILEGIFGKIPITGVNILLQEGAAKLRDYRKTLEGATGASKEMASVMRDTVQGRLNSLSSAVEGVKITLFGMTAGPLSKAIEKTTEWVRVNEELIATKIGEFLAGLLNNFGEIVETMKAVGKGLAVFFALVAILKTLIFVMTIVNLVMAANPVTWIVLGIVALIAALAAAVIWWDEIVAALKKFHQFIVTKVVDGILWLKDTFSGLAEPFKQAIANLGGPMGWLVSSAADLIEDWGPVDGFFTDIADSIFAAWDGVSAFFKDLWAGATEAFEKALGVIGPIVDKIVGFSEKVSKVSDSVAERAKSLPKKAFEAGQSFRRFLGLDEPKGPAKSGFFSRLFSDDPDNSGPVTNEKPQVISPQERTAGILKEQRTTTQAEVTIKDETGRAEMTKGKQGSGVKLESTGSF